MATANEAIEMLTEVLLIDHDPHPGVTAEYLSPAASLRKQADKIESREEIIQRAWNMVRSHKPSNNTGIIWADDHVRDQLGQLSLHTSDELQSRIQSVYMWLHEKIGGT